MVTKEDVVKEEKKPATEEEKPATKAEPTEPVVKQQVAQEHPLVEVILDNAA